MLIPNDQMSRLNEAAFQDFSRRLISFLRRELPAQTAELDDAALAKRITDCKARAARHGILSEAGISQFVCLTFAAPEFDNLPEVKAFFADPSQGMEPEEKLSLLVDELANDDDD